MVTGSLRARMTSRNGAPILEIDGNRRAPLIFFFNTEVDSGWKFLEPQVRLAAAAGVHIHSFCLPWPWYDPGVEPDFSVGERFMDAFLAVDPEALFIPRMRCEGSPEWLERHPDARIVYASGESPLMSSMASEEWWTALEAGYRRAVHHFESGRYADRIIGYHPVGQNTNEWFHFEYWLHGPDYSSGNVDGFRKWLRRTYPSVEALRAAWNQPTADFRTAAIPAPESGPAEPYGSGSAPFRVFLSADNEQDRIDFHRYTNDIVADRLRGLASLVKEETHGRKLVVLFYGYFFEMHAAEAGHFAMEAMLQCPDVDMLVSPLSYLDRQPGEAGGFMSAVDSVPLHGKVWLVENDYRTHSTQMDALPDWMSAVDLGAQSPDQERTLGVVKREFGSMLTHRCGTWWMDLLAAGAFSDPEVWRAIASELSPLCDELLADPTPFEPEVAVVVDERSICDMHFPPTKTQACYSPVYDLVCRHGRAHFGRSGAVCGYYYLADFLAGRLPRCRAYWFLNLCAVDGEMARRILEPLDAAACVAVWQYAPAAVSAQRGDPEAARRLTGFELTLDAGPMGSVGLGPLAGLEWGRGTVLDPRMHAEPGPDVAVWARYCQGSGASTAYTQHGRHTSVFVGDIELPFGMLGRLFGAVGVHTWSRDGAAVSFDGRWLFVHHGDGGPKRIHLPAGVRIDAAAGVTTCSATEVEAVFRPGETRVFRVLPT